MTGLPESIQGGEMTDEALRLAFNLACKGRDRAERRVKDLESLTMDLRVRCQQLETRLRILDLMEQEGRRRLLHAVEDVSEEQFSMLVREGGVQQ